MSGPNSGQAFGDLQAKRIKFRRPLRSLNRLLLFVTLIFISITFYKLKFHKERLLEIKPATIADSDATVPSGPIANTQPFEYYSDVVSKRDIFSLEAENPPPVATENAVVAQPQKSLTDLTSSLKLVGIVLSGEPEAIFENLQTQETVFLRKGDQINEVKIEEIHEGVVTLSNAGQKIDVRVDTVGQ